MASWCDAINSRGSGWVSVVGKNASFIDFPNFGQLQQEK
jgi:hypothetical protein